MRRSDQFNKRSLCSVSDKQDAKSDTKQDTKSSLEDKLCSSDGDWHISCGLVIQRFPLIVPELNIIERSLNEYNLMLEYEKSLLSEYDYAIQKVR